MPELSISWPDVIREFRRIGSLKQEAAAQLLGVSQGTLSRWESGATRPPVAVQNRVLRHLNRVRSPLQTLDWIETFRRLPVAGYIATRDKALVAITDTLAERLGIPGTEIENHFLHDIFWGEVLELAEKVREEPSFTGGVVRFEACWHARINPNIRKNLDYFSHYVVWPHLDDRGNILMIGQGRIGIDKSEAREIRGRLGGPIRFTYNIRSD